MYFLWYIIIGILAGFVAGKFMRGGGFGLFTNLLVGVLGGWVFGLLGIATTGLLGSLITSIVGAVVLLWIVSLFNNKKRIDL